MNKGRFFAPCALIACTAFACTVQNSLGDLPLGDAGEAGEGLTAGTGHSSGGSQPDGSGGTSVGTGGTSVGTGGASVGTGGTGSGATSGDAGEPGTGGTGTAGTGSSGTGSGGSSPCYSPEENLELALDPNAEGCECADETASYCMVLYESRTRIHEIALQCLDGRWASVEDGACFPQGPTGTACVVDGYLYWPGDEFGDPFSCNTCTCRDDGGLSCTEIGCDDPCPEGTEAGSRCLTCGPADECLTVEHKCLPHCEVDEECDFGNCVDGVCRMPCG